jgi:hypothetical protein
MRNRTSSGERVQFSVENAYTLRCLTPAWIAPATTSSSAASPARCPSMRVWPRRFAQRPLPSITIATCPGIFPFGNDGG